MTVIGDIAPCLGVKMAKDGKKAAIGLGVIGATVLGLWALTRKAEAIPPADIVLSDLVIEPSEVYVGEQVTISATTTNIGEIAGSYEIMCEVI